MIYQAIESSLISCVRLSSNSSVLVIGIFANV
nr:MAG TPA: hypothetical protein [Caudoviricetes sp.]